MDLAHKNFARQLLWDKTFQEMWAEVYHINRFELLEELQSRTLAGDTKGCCECCGKVEQLEETIPLIFKVAQFRDDEPNPVPQWYARMNDPQGKLLCQLKQSTREQAPPPNPPRRRGLIQFWDQITSMLRPQQTKA